MRFFAAFVVVLHHYMALVPFPAWLAVVAQHGQAGVSFFFVLSGFILTYNYQAAFVAARGPAVTRRFYRARFARVYPLHLLMLLMATPLTLALHGATLGADAWLLAGAWLAHLAAVHAWLPIMAIQALYDAPSWSISAEFLFYLLFPLTIAPLFPLRDRPRTLLALAAALVALQAAASVVTYETIAGWLTESPGAAAWVHPRWAATAWAWLRVPEFLVGCLLGTWFLARRHAPTGPAWRRHVLLLVALGAAYGLCWLPAGDLWLYVIRQHVAFVPAFAAVIAGLALGPTWLSAWLERPALVLLGEASFALYLLHFPILVLQSIVFKPTTPAGWLTGIACCVVLSLACHLWIERPARRWLRGPAQGVAA